MLRHSDTSLRRASVLPALGFFVGVGLVVWVLRDLDFARLFEVLRSAAVWPLLVLVLATLVETAIRAYRWQQILSPVRSVSPLRLFGAIMAGHLINTIVPIRVGLLVRAWLVARLERLPIGSLLATVAIDRLVDAIVFAGFAALVLLANLLPFESGDVQRGITVGGGATLLISLAGITALLALRRGRLARLVARYLMRPLAYLPSRWQAATITFGRAFVDGVVWPRAVWRGVLIISASVAIKLVAISYFLWAGLAFGVVLTPGDYVFLMVFLGFLAVFAASLGIVGGFTAGAIFALGKLGIDLETALAITLALEASIHLTVATTGASAIWMQGQGIRALSRAASAEAQASHQ